MANLDDPHEQYLARRARDSMQLDLRGIHDMQAEVLSNQRPYTYNHNAGPREVTLLNSRDDEMVDELGDMNTALSDAADLADINADIQAGISRDMRTELRWIREGSDTLPEIRGILEHISAATYGELALQSIGIGLNIQRMVREDSYHEESMRGIQGMNEDIDEGLGEIVEEIQGLRVEIEGGLDNISGQIICVGDKIDDVYSVVKAGSEQIASTMIETSKAIIEAIGGGFWELGLLMAEIEEKKSGELRALGGNIAHHFELLNQQEEKRHQELISTLEYLAVNRLTIEAGQKYKSASAQYKIGNFRIALKDIRAALELKSDHIPSLMLYGKIAAARTRWANAKDAFYSASQHALLQKDETAYQAAIIELSRIERLVGNQEQGTKILQEAVEEEGREAFKDVVLSHIKFEYLKVQAIELARRYEKESGYRKLRLEGQILDIIVESTSDNPEYWKEIQEVPQFANLREKIPEIKEPFIRLKHVVYTRVCMSGLRVRLEKNAKQGIEFVSYESIIRNMYVETYGAFRRGKINGSQGNILKMMLGEFETAILRFDREMDKLEEKWSPYSEYRRSGQRKMDDFFEEMDNLEKKCRDEVYQIFEELMIALGERPDYDRLDAEKDSGEAYGKE